MLKYDSQFFDIIKVALMGYCYLFTKVYLPNLYIFFLILKIFDQTWPLSLLLLQLGCFKTLQPSWISKLVFLIYKKTKRYKDNRKYTSSIPTESHLIRPIESFSDLAKSRHTLFKYNGRSLAGGRPQEFDARFN